MIEIKTTNSVALWGSQHRIVMSAVDTAAPFLCTHAASILRLLILMLVGLLFLLIGLVLLMGHAEIGAPIVGSVLFIGFSAAQFRR
jgi:hypothetical protein